MLSTVLVYFMGGHDSFGVLEDRGVVVLCAMQHHLLLGLHPSMRAI